MSTAGTPIPVPVTATQFRGDYPEFANISMFPDSMVNFWLNLATLLLNPLRWQNELGHGIELFAAHNCMIEAGAVADAALGNIPGLTKGPVASEGVGKANVSYAVGEALDPKAQHWNLTVYGTRFWFISKMMGAGPVHLSGSGVTGSSAIGFSIGVFGPGVGGNF